MALRRRRRRVVRRGCRLFVVDCVAGRTKMWRPASDGGCELAMLLGCESLSDKECVHTHPVICSRFFLLSSQKDGTGKKEERRGLQRFVWTDYLGAFKSIYAKVL